jgi:Flp pilus assembly protein TadG
MRPARFWRDEDGAALVEYVLVLPALLALTFGLMQLGGMAWTQEALNYAVQEAARCAIVRPDLCGNPGDIQQYAASQALGLSVPPNTFSVAPDTCGTDVRADLPYDFILSPFNTTAVQLSAEACRT